MKRTQIVTHVMPTEIDEYLSIVEDLTESAKYLENTDWISIYATLNLSPELIVWNDSELDTSYFIEKFKEIEKKCYWANEVIFEIITDNSILGTTSQKRKAIKGNYDQFIFLDCDIAFHPTTLKYILETSYQLDGMYIVTPQTVKLWDSTWDILVHKDFKNKEYGYEKIHNPLLTKTQNVNDVGVLSSFSNSINEAKNRSFNFKFACGWFTLYSKSILDFIGIPDWLGHYGPEDTNIMYCSELAVKKGYDIRQYILDGIYVSENYVNRDSSYKQKLKLINLKEFFRNQAENVFMNMVNEFNNNC